MIIQDLWLGTRSGLTPRRKEDLATVRPLTLRLVGFTFIPIYVAHAH
jgi:hypothetical protein